MNPTTIESIRIKGFRSLADVELSDLPKATVLIGANGSGKSNFIRFFEMLRWMLHYRRLAEFVAIQGGADDQLFGGNSVTPRLEAEITLNAPQAGQIAISGFDDYRFALSYAHPDRLIFTEEAFDYFRGPDIPIFWNHLGSGHTESNSFQNSQASTIVNRIKNCLTYQFHDTSGTSNFKKFWDVQDSTHLRSDGSNLSAVLYRLEREDTRRYELICRHIGRILPGFDRFAIEESYGKALLRWKAKWTDKTIGAHLTSDGSLRFFALVTLLNLPREMLPDVILLDEPELGLHPAAVSLVGGMIKSLSVERQIIVATQSPLLVDTFALDEIFVLDLESGRTKIRKLNPPEYETWLEDGYSTGQLWWKNLFGGYP